MEGVAKRMFFSHIFEDVRHLHVVRNDPVEGETNNAGEGRGVASVLHTGTAYPL